MTTFSITRSIRLRVPPGALWEFLADTDRLNIEIGIPPVGFAPIEGRAGFYNSRMRYFGIPLKYIECPFDFIKERRYEVERIFPLSVLTTVTGGIRIRPDGDGSELEVYGVFGPKNLVSSALARTILYAQTIGNVLKTARAFEQSYAAQTRLSGIPDSMLPEIDREQLSRRMGRLRSSFPAETRISADLIGRFERHIAECSPIESASMRPFELADRWLADRYQTLSLFLHGAHAGIVDIHWAVLCPNCNAADPAAITLAQLRSEHHCDTCGIQYGADLAESVEARFSVNSAIRRGRTGEIYCIGGPANMPQIISQLRIPPESERTVGLPLPNGTIRIRTYQTPNIATLVVSDAAAAIPGVDVRLTSTGLECSVASIHAGEVQLRVSNELEQEALLVVESESWRESAATAAIVTSLQDFRDLFPQEAVAPGEEIGIGSITLLFTDLKGSTTLYKRVGDIPAFTFVQNHFRFLTEKIARNHGGVFKTMGDAVMASFPHAADAVIAAVEMQEAWEQFRREYGDHEGLQLKVGIHEGAAIAINNKGRLDCFGSTVNIASHLQKLSVGGDIILSNEVDEDTSSGVVNAEIESRTVRERYEATLKGYQERTFKVCRLTLRPR